MRTMELLGCLLLSELERLEGKLMSLVRALCFQLHICIRYEKASMTILIETISSSLQGSVFESPILKMGAFLQDKCNKPEANVQCHLLIG